MRHVQDPPVKTGIVRIQNLIADFRAVNIEFKEPAGCNIRSRRPDLLPGFKAVPEVRRRLQADVRAVTDPLSFPVSHVHQPRLKRSYLRLYPAAVVIPHRHLPEIPGVGLQVFL
ncbi:hypothetical protein FQZ97_879850 [compost metagenome]